MDLGARTKGFQSVTRRFPIGPCSFVSPFNFPLNLAAHKVAPALAVGCAPPAEFAFSGDLHCRVSFVQFSCCSFHAYMLRPM